VVKVRNRLFEVFVRGIPDPLSGPPKAELKIESLDDSRRAPTTAPGVVERVGSSCQRVRFNDVALPYNGHYKATVTTSSLLASALVDEACAGTPDNEQEFFMGVSPVPPTGVNAGVKPPQQGVVVSWEKNPEPDVVRYRVLRAKGADVKFEPVLETARTSFTDVGTAGGGEFRYQVIALRRGAKADDPLLASDPSAPSGKVVVAAPAPPPPGTGIPTLTGPRTVTRSSPPPRPQYITPGETGFSETLPFDGTVPPQVIEEPGDLAAVPVEGLRSEEAQSDRKRSLALLAAGLLATVLALHLLWVKSEVDREPLEVLNPE
jgi:hypothetical protein